MARPVHLAIVQKTAHFLDLDRSVDLALTIIKEAAAHGANLLVFGECWLTGYPAWLDHGLDYARWDDSSAKRVFQNMVRNSVSLSSPAFRAIMDASKDHGVCICMGFNEVDTPNTGTIFNSVAILDKGDLVLHHRKLMPTFTEKLLYGLGDGRGLYAVETSVGRVGALICWEHWMPLARQAVHRSGEDIHIALWPQVHGMLQIASRHYAFEGRCYVVAAGQLLYADQMPEEIRLANSDPSGETAGIRRTLLNGGSAVIGPDGAYLSGPSYDLPDIVYHTIADVTDRYKETMTLDVSNHYQRHDIFTFDVHPVGRTQH